MKSLMWFAFFAALVTAATYWFVPRHPKPTPTRRIEPALEERGFLGSHLCSWYARGWYTDGTPFRGRRMTCASNIVPRGTALRFVRTLSDGTKRTVRVRCNDYGPDPTVHPDRAFDLARAASDALGFTAQGLCRLEVWIDD